VKHECEASTDPVSAAPAFLCAFMSFVLISVAAFGVRVEWFVLMAVALAGIVSILIGAFSGRRVHVYAIGIGAACGGIIPFGARLANLYGDQGTVPFLFAWLVSIVGFLVVTALVGTIAAWGAHELRWLRP
jgi:tetrahydromethanopterin S-methyltransferase subunit C